MELAPLEDIRIFIHLAVNTLITNKMQNIFIQLLNILASRNISKIN